MPRTVLTILRKGTVYAVLLAAVFISSVLWYLTTARGEALLRRLAVEQLAPRLGVDLSVGSLETNLFTRLTLTDVSVAVPDTDIPPLAQFTRGTIHYSLIDLLSFRLTVSSVTIDSLVVQVTRDSTGAVILPGSGSQKSEPAGQDDGGQPFSFWLGTLELRNGAVIYDDHAIPMKARLDGLEASLSHAPGAGYRIEAGADSGTVLVQGFDVAIEEVSARVAYRASDINIDHVACRVAGMDVSAGGSIALDASPPVIDTDITIDGDFAMLAALAGESLPGRIRDMSGPFEAHAAVTTGESGFELAYTIDAAPLAVGSLAFSELSAGGLFENRTVRVDSIYIATPAGGTADLTGWVQFDSLLTHEAAANFDEFRIDRLWRFIAGTGAPYRGMMEGEMDTRGPLTQYRDITAAARARIYDISYETESYPDISLDLQYENRNAAIELTQDRNTLDGTIALADSLDGSFTADIADAGFFNGFLGSHRVDGQVTIDGEIGGALSSPDLRLTFKGNDASYRGFPIGHLAGALRYYPGSFALYETTFEGRVTDAGTLAFPPLPEGVGGQFAYNGSVSFLDGSLKADARLDLIEPSFNTIRFEHGTAVAAIRDTVVSITSLDLNRNELSIDATGRYQFGNQVLYARASAHDSTHRVGSATFMFDLADSLRRNGELQVTGLDLARVQVFADSLPPLGGLANGSLTFELVPEAPMSLHAVAAVDSFRYASYTIDRIIGAGVLADGSVTVDSLVVSTGGNRLSAKGRLVYGEWPQNGIKGLDDARTEGRIRADSLVLGALSEYLPENMRIEGMASTDISWDGTVADPWLSGYIRINDGILRTSPDIPPVEDIDIALKLDRSRVSIEEFTASSRDLTVQAWGMVMAHAISNYEGALTVAVNGEDALSAAGRYRDGKLSGTAAGTGLNLAAVQGFAPMLRNLEGTLLAELAIDGTPQVSNVTGYISAKNLAFTPPMLRERISDGALHVTFDHEQVALDTLAARLGGGTISGTGSMEVEGNLPKAMNLSLDGKSMHLERDNFYDIRIDGVSVNGAVADGQIVLEGDVSLGETRITRNIRTRDIIAMARKRPERPGTPNPLLDSARLSIRLYDSDAVWIDNNLAKLRLHPELTIAGSPRAPVITGRLSAEEGSLFYLDRKFDLTRLYLDFIDPDRTNPLLDIQAETSVRSAQNPGDEPFVITLAISGSAESPRFSLTSNPALDQADILALLTFGATRSQLAASTGQTEILQSRAELLSSQQLSNYLSREARSMLGLDDLSIQGNLFNAGKASGPQLLASDTVTDRLKVTYTTTVGEQNEQSIRLDYRLSRFFSLEGQTNQDGDSGLDLKYRLKF